MLKSFIQRGFLEIRCCEHWTIDFHMEAHPEIDNKNASFQQNAVTTTTNLRDRKPNDLPE